MVHKKCLSLHHACCLWIAAYIPGWVSLCYSCSDIWKISRHHLPAETLFLEEVLATGFSVCRSGLQHPKIFWDGNEGMPSEAWNNIFPLFEKRTFGIIFSGQYYFLVLYYFLCMFAGATTFSIKTCSTKTLSVMRLGIMDIISAFSINNTQYNDSRHNNWMSSCWVSHFLIVMLEVIFLSVIMLSVVMLSVVVYVCCLWVKAYAKYLLGWLWSYQLLF